jgi:hypothetical protein
MNYAGFNFILNAKKPELYLPRGYRIKEFNGTVYAQKTVFTCIIKSEKGDLSAS